MIGINMSGAWVRFVGGRRLIARRPATHLLGVSLLVCGAPIAQPVAAQVQASVAHLSLNRPAPTSFADPDVGVTILASRSLGRERSIKYGLAGAVVGAASGWGLYELTADEPCGFGTILIADCSAPSSPRRSIMVGALGGAVVGVFMAYVFEGTGSSAALQLSPHIGPVGQTGFSARVPAR